MIVRNYRGKSIPEALASVKAELGQEAMVLATRRVKHGLFRSEFEVTAALAPLRFGMAVGERWPAGGDKSETCDLITAKNAARRGVVAESGQGPRSVDAKYVNRLVAPLRHELFRLREDLRRLSSELEARDAAVAASANEQDMSLAAEQLWGLLQQLPVSVGPAAKHGAIEELRLRLQRSGMSAAGVEGLLAAVRARRPELDAATPSLDVLSQGISDELRGQIRCVGGIEREAVGPVALVGPPGVGKTTTLAKVAVRAALLRDRPVALIGFDNDGIAAAASVKGLADTIGLPYRLADDAQELRYAIDELTPQNLVIIDTSGHLAGEDGALERLGEALAVAGGEAHLVLSADLRAEEMDRMIRAHQSAAPRSISLTKLDQSVGHGAIYDASALSGLPLMYLCNGRRIPEDIEEAEAAEAATRIMGLQLN